MSQAHILEIRYNLDKNFGSFYSENVRVVKLLVEKEKENKIG